MGFFSNKSIFFRLSLANLFIVGIFVVFAFITSVLFSKDEEAKIVKTVENINKQNIEKIDHYIIDIENITKLPLSYQLSQESYINLLHQFNQTDQLTSNLQNMNEAIFTDIMSCKPSIDACYIYNQNGIADYKSKQAIYAVENPSEEPWFAQAQDSFGNSMILDSHEVHYLADMKEPMYVFSVVRGILQLHTADIIGTLVINTDVSYFYELMGSSQLSPDHRIIISSEGKTVYDTQEENITQAIPEELQVWTQQNTGSNLITIQGEEMFAVCSVSPHTGWVFTSLVPTEFIFAELRSTQNIILIATLLYIILTTFAFFLISRQIVKPIKRLQAFMKLVENGKFDIQIKETSGDEIGQLSNSFNMMIQRINSLINEVYLKNLNETKLELQMLQVQINPHFLYNTLESISMMAIINDDEVTSDMSHMLGAILRYSISDYDQEVLLKDELTHLQTYINLQEIRFKEQFEIKINVEESLYNVKVVKMILQPILENSIYHGMNNLQHTGRISISAQRVGQDTLEITVEDNGTGLDQAKVTLLNDFINGKNDSFKSIGLKNVHKRLQMNYGEGYGLVITSDLEQGTSIKIKTKLDQGLIE